MDNKRLKHENKIHFYNYLFYNKSVYYYICITHKYRLCLLSNNTIMDFLSNIYGVISLVIDEIIKDYGEPVKPTPDEIETLKREIISNPANNDRHRQKNFILIKRVSGEILFSYNVDKYLGLTHGFDLMTFLSKVTDGSGSWNYLSDYLSWAKATYVFAVKNRDRLDWTNACFKTRIPMKLSDDNIYWISHEIHPLELDAKNNIISHINTYTISNKYIEKTPVNIMAEIYINDFFNEEWTRELAETRFTNRPCSLH